MEAGNENAQDPPPFEDDLDEHTAVQNQLSQLRHQLEHQQREHQYQMEDIIARQEDLMQQLQNNLWLQWQSITCKHMQVWLRIINTQEFCQSKK